MAPKLVERSASLDAYVEQAVAKRESAFVDALNLQRQHFEQQLVDVNRRLDAFQLEAWGQQLGRLERRQMQYGAQHKVLLSKHEEHEKRLIDLELCTASLSPATSCRSFSSEYPQGTKDTVQEIPPLFAEGESFLGEPSVGPRGSPSSRASADSLPFGKACRPRPTQSAPVAAALGEACLPRVSRSAPPRPCAVPRLDLSWVFTDMGDVQAEGDAPREPLWIGAPSARSPEPRGRSPAADVPVCSRPAPRREPDAGDGASTRGAAPPRSAPEMFGIQVNLLPISARDMSGFAKQDAQAPHDMRLCITPTKPASSRTIAKPAADTSGAASLAEPTTMRLCRLACSESGVPPQPLSNKHSPSTPATAVQDAALALRHFQHEPGLWEAMPFVGLPCLGRSRSVAVGLGVPLSLAAQGVFCVAMGLAAGPGRAGGECLAREAAAGLELAEQRAFTSGAAAYLAPLFSGPLPALPAGPCASLLLLLPLVLRASREVCSSADLGLAVARAVPELGGLRAALALALLAARAAVSLALLLAGAGRLSRCGSLEDLVLHGSAALALVLHLDDLSGCCSAPRASSAPGPRSGRLGVSAALGPPLAIACFLLLLAPRGQRLRDSYAEACAGPMSACLPDCSSPSGSR